MQFVDEQDVPPLALFDLAQQGLDPVLELSPELRPRYECPEVEGDDHLVLEPIRDVAVDDPPGEPLDDGRLADARVADQDRVVLGSARQNLDDAADLLVPSNDRVELASAGLLREVARILLDRLERRLGVLGGDALAATDGAQGFQHFAGGGACLSEEIRRGATTLGQRQKQMLDGDKIVVKLLGLGLRRLQHESETVIDVGSGASLHVRPGLQEVSEAHTESCNVDSNPLQKDRGKSVFLIQKSQ